MTDEQHDEMADEAADEIEDEMPLAGAAPCGDIFAQADALYATDADADIVGDDAAD